MSIREVMYEHVLYAKLMLSKGVNLINCRVSLRKFLIVFFTGVMLFSVSSPAWSDSPSKPTLVSFTLTPDTIDVATSNAVASFDLTVQNPTGIASTQTMVTLADSAGNTLITYLTRTDMPINLSLQNVKFHGTLVIPSTLPPGAYTARSAPVIGLDSSGANSYPSDAFYASTTSKVVGAANSLLIRNGGNLNYNYSTFIGPTFNNVLGASFTNPKYLTAALPIWKVGESFDPSNFYQLNVATLSLKVSSSTPSTCPSNGATLTLIATGPCSFTVYTDKTSDYQYKKDDESVSITSARTKPIYTVGTIPTQSSAILPLSIQGPFVYGPLGLVTPVSATPTVCYPTGTYINIVSGGTCTLNYSTQATPTVLGSDIFPLTFQITRTSQSISFVTPGTAVFSRNSLTLAATSSSGLPVAFQSDAPSICSVNGNSLSLLKPGSCVVEAIQAGSATIAPASLAQTILVSSSPAPSRKIICVKAGKSKVFVGTKCPAGYKVKK